MGWLSGRLRAAGAGGVGGNARGDDPGRDQRRAWFFERRSLKELFAPETQWGDLTLDEQQSLAALGWYGAVWDGKYHAQWKDKLPASVKEDRGQLSDDEKVAIVHLGFYAYEDYKKHFSKSAKEFCDYVY